MNRNPYLGWNIGTEDDPKFTQNVFRTLPQRDWVKKAGSTVKGAAKAVSDIEKGRQQVRREITSGALNQLSSTARGVGKALTAGGKESMESRRGLGSFHPWKQLGISESQYKTNLKAEKAKYGLDQQASTQLSDNTKPGAVQEKQVNNTQNNIDYYANTQKSNYGLQPVGPEATWNYTLEKDYQKSKKDRSFDLNKLDATNKEGVRTNKPKKPNKHMEAFKKAPLDDKLKAAQSVLNTLDMLTGGQDEIAWKGTGWGGMGYGGGGFVVG